jgi:hypothetical protein
LTALLKQLDSFETLQNVAFRDDRAGSSEAAMLRHKLGKMSAKLARTPKFSNAPTKNYNWLVRTTCCPEAVT